MPRRRWVGETETALTAQAGMLARPGTVRSITQVLTVATGDAGSADSGSHTPVVRRWAMRGS